MLKPIKIILFPFAWVVIYFLSIVGCIWTFGLGDPVYLRKTMIDDYWNK